MSEIHRLGYVGGGRADRCPTGAASFAEVVDARQVEVRAELLREASHWLSEYERHRRDEDRGRLLATLDHLALLVNA